MDEWKAAALGAIDGARGSLVALADQLHGRPEVGFEEYASSASLVEFLRGQGFVVNYPVGGVETAFRADWGADAPVVALLAEYDALPGVGHGCGHNLIAAGAIGAAVGVAAVMSELDGTLAVIGTPAEEVLYDVPGKVRMLKAGVFDDVDVALMFHPWTGSGLLAGDRALVTLDVEFHGRPAHAAADPWNGANALDGVMQTFNAINALRQHLKPEARIHGKITHGGEVPNIIHAFASARIVVRAEDQDYLYSNVVPKVENCARGAALATGTQVDIQRVSPIDSTISNPVIARVIADAAREVGVQFGEPIVMGGSTDFGNVSRLAPATYFLMDIDLTEGAAWHSKEVAEAPARPAAHRAMLDAARIMALSVIELLRRPELVAEARSVHPVA
jgi:amidohydrolase